MHTTYVATKDLFEALIWNKRCFGRREGQRDEQVPTTLRSARELRARETTPREAVSHGAASREDALPRMALAEREPTSREDAAPRTAPASREDAAPRTAPASREP